MKIIVIAADGFEDVEMITTLDILSRANIDYDIASIQNKQYVKGKFNAIVEALNFEGLNQNSYDGIFIPGGPGHELILEDIRIKKWVQDFNSANKVVAAICAAPTILYEAGILAKRSYTSYPGFAMGSGNTGEDVVIDQNIITGKGFSVTQEFANQLVKLLSSVK